MTPELSAWQRKYNLPNVAMGELAMIFAPPVPAVISATSEGATQSQIRCEAPYLGYHAYRNNNGAFKDDTGRWVRYGLANDSKKSNSVVKSSDLISIIPVTILPHHVGRVIGAFGSFEVKKPGWTKPENDRDRAQLNWGKIIISNGGLFGFVTDPNQAKKLVEGYRK